MDSALSQWMPLGLRSYIIGMRKLSSTEIGWTIHVGRGPAGSDVGDLQYTWLIFKRSDLNLLRRTQKVVNAKNGRGKLDESSL